MKLEYNNTLAGPSSTTVASVLPTLYLLEPINFDVILEDDDLDLLGHQVRVQLTGTVHVDRYETIVRHGTPEFAARPMHTDKFLDIAKSFVIHAKRSTNSIDLTSLGVDASQLPSSLDIMGHSSHDEDGLIPSTEPPVLRMSVKYIVKVATKLQHDRDRELQREFKALGTSLSERESHLETAMRWSEVGYTETVALQRGTTMFPLLKAPHPCQMMQKSLAVKLLSYEPFTVRQQSELATTRIMLDLTFNDPHQDAAIPPCIKISADWALQPTTEILNASARQQEFICMRLDDQGVLNGKKQKMAAPTWVRELRSRFEGTTWTAAEQELSIATTITSTLPRRFLTPTFFTETLQHTYNLKLKVYCQFPGRVFGHATHSLDFNLPIVVIYQAPGYTSDQSPPDYSV